MQKIRQLKNLEDLPQALGWTTGGKKEAAKAVCSTILWSKVKNENDLVGRITWQAFTT